MVGYNRFIKYNDAIDLVDEEDLDDEDNEENNNSGLLEFEFNISTGTVKIMADKAIQVKTADGDIEIIYYVVDGNLYHYGINGEDELYAVGVEDIYFANRSGELIGVLLKEDSSILKKSIHIVYVYDPVTEFVFETAGGRVVIRANKALPCRGSAGASNKIFYMLNNELYLYVNENESILYAMNVKDIYYEGRQSEVITVVIDEDTIIMKESLYLEYK